MFPHLRSRALPLLLCLGATLAGSPAESATKRYGLLSFDSIEVLGDMVVDIVDDYRVAAVAEGTSSALDTLSVEINSRGTLVIRQMAEGRFGRRDPHAPPVHVRVTAQNLKNLSVRGGGQVSVRGLHGDAVVIVLEGSGQVDAGFERVRNVQLRVTGAGSMIATGRADTLTATSIGAGGIDASGLTARDLSVRVAGAGNSAFVASGTASVVASGAASAAVVGRARCTVNNIGSGTVSCGRAAPSTDEPG